VVFNVNGNMVPPSSIFRTPPNSFGNNFNYSIQTIMQEQKKRSDIRFNKNHIIQYSIKTILIIFHKKKAKFTLYTTQFIDFAVTKSHT
jgi:hypothetical protein